MVNYDIIDWLETNFIMARYDFAPASIEDCLPWERRIYIMQLQKWLKDKEQEARNK